MSGMTFLKRNWFVLAMLVALALAFAAPGVGRWLNMGKWLGTFAVVAIFFISGFTLPSESILSGLRRHLMISSAAMIFSAGGLPPSRVLSFCRGSRRR